MGRSHPFQDAQIPEPVLLALSMAAQRVCALAELQSSLGLGSNIGIMEKKMETLGPLKRDI